MAKRKTELDRLKARTQLAEELYRTTRKPRLDVPAGVEELPSVKALVELTATGSGQCFVELVHHTQPRKCLDWGAAISFKLSQVQAWGRLRLVDERNSHTVAKLKDGRMVWVNLKDPYSDKQAVKSLAAGIRVGPVPAGATYKLSWRPVGHSCCVKCHSVEELPAKDMDGCSFEPYFCDDCMECQACMDESNQQGVQP